MVELNFNTGWKAIAPSVEIPHCCISKAAEENLRRWKIKIILIIKIINSEQSHRLHNIFEDAKISTDICSVPQISVPFSELMINPRTNTRIKFSTKSDLTIFQNWPLTQRSSLSASAINWAPWSLIIGFLQMVIRRSPGILSRSGRRYRRLSCHATPWRLVAWCYVWIKQHSVVSW